MIDRVVRWRILLEILIIFLVFCFGFLPYSELMLNASLHDFSTIRDIVKFWIIPFLIILCVFIVVGINLKNFDLLVKMARKEFIIIICCGLVFKFLDYIVYNRGAGIPYRDNYYSSSSANIAFFWRYAWVLAYFGYLLSLWGRGFLWLLRSKVSKKAIYVVILICMLLVFLFIAMFMSTSK